MKLIVFHYDHATEKEESCEVYFKIVVLEVVQFDSSTNDMWNIFFVKIVNTGFPKWIEVEESELTKWYKQILTYIVL